MGHGHDDHGHSSAHGHAAHGHDAHGHGAGDAHAAASHGPAEFPPMPNPRVISPAREDFEQPWPGRLLLWPAVWTVVGLCLFVAARSWGRPIGEYDREAHAAEHGEGHGAPAHGAPAHGAPSKETPAGGHEEAPHGGGEAPAGMSAEHGK